MKSSYLTHIRTRTHTRTCTHTERERERVCEGETKNRGKIAKAQNLGSSFRIIAFFDWTSGFRGLCGSAKKRLPFFNIDHRPGVQTELLPLLKANGVDSHVN